MERWELSSIISCQNLKGKQYILQRIEHIAVWRFLPHDKLFSWNLFIFFPNSHYQKDNLNSKISLNNLIIKSIKLLTIKNVNHTIWKKFKISVRFTCMYLCVKSTAVCVPEFSASPSITQMCLTWVVSPGKGFWEGRGACLWFATSSLRSRNILPVTESPPSTHFDGVVTSLLFLSCISNKPHLLVIFILACGLLMAGAILILLFNPLDSHISDIYLKT